MNMKGNWYMKWSGVVPGAQMPAEVIAWFKKKKKVFHYATANN